MTASGEFILPRRTLHRPQDGDRRPAGAARRNVAGELGAIEHMAPPGILEASPADQIDRRLPFFQEAQINPEPPQCFT